MSDPERRDAARAAPDEHDPKDHAGTPAGRMEHRRTEELTHADFRTLPIEYLAKRTGLEPPAGDSPAEERAWREKAWQNHVKDLEHRDEWGTAAQATEPPKGEDPEL